MKLAKSFFVVFFVSLIFFSLTQGAPVFADESVSSLKQEIEGLKAKITALEARDEQPKQEKGGFFRLFKKKEKAWDPFEDMEVMQKEMDKMLKRSFSEAGKLSKGMYRSDLFYDENFKLTDKKDSYVIEFDMNELDPSKVDVHIENGYLTVKGERSVVEKGGNQATSYASFLTSIMTPPDADSAKMKTERKGDKLIITLPKKMKK